MAARRKVPDPLERLLKQAAGDFGDYRATAPAPEVYGVFQPAYAQSLGKETGSVGADILNQMALRNGAANEREAYGLALEQANATTKDLQQSAAHYGFMKDIGERNLEYTKEGIGGLESLGVDAQGRPMIVRDPTLQYVGNTEVLNNNQAERFNQTATGVKTLAEAGYVQTPEDVGRRITSPWSTETDRYIPGMTPRDQTEKFRVEERLDEGLTAEQQLEIEKQKAASRDKGVQGKWVWDPTTQRYTWQLSGDIEDMQGVPGAPPIPNPNAGAQGGGAPAKPAANATPVENGKAIAEQLFPGIRVTQNRRDPNSPLGRKNPGSWHNRSGGAVDVAPIKGMTFEQYVKKYRDAGYDIIEARNEVTNPSKHATGPHWHVVIGGKAQQRMSTASNVPTRAQTPRTNARVLLNRAKQRGLEATMNSDGSVTVQTPQGARTYGPDGKLRNG